MQHSVMLKKTGIVAIVIGLAIMVTMSLLFAFFQQFAIAWSYFITVGIYFIVAGVLVWLGGMAKQSMEEKDAISAAEAQQIEDGTEGARGKI